MSGQNSCDAVNVGLSNLCYKLQKVVTKIFNFAQFKTNLLENFITQESKLKNMYLSKKSNFHNGSAQGRMTKYYSFKVSQKFYLVEETLV